MKTINLEMKQTKNGAPYKLFTMEDNHKLAVFNFDARYNDLNVGVDLPDSELVFDPAYSSYKLRPLPKPAQIKGAGGYRNAQIEKVMDRKEESIKTFQESKQEAITLSAAQRDAVLMVTTFDSNEPFPTDAELQEKIETWMKYFLNLHNQPFL